MDKKKGELSFKVKTGYGSGDLGGNLFFTVVAFWLMNYLTDEVGLSASLAGAALMIGKIWDAVTDPAVGYLSDRTRTRLGRRRPWMLAGSVPLGLSFFFLFTNPRLEGQSTLFIWAALAYMAVCTFYTFVNIPYNAMTPELTKDFDERTVLNGYRMMFAVVGTLIGAGTALPIINAAAGRTAGYMIMGGIYGAIMTVTALVPVITVKEPVHGKFEKGENIFRSYLSALKTRPFLLILLPWVFNIIGITIVTATLIYYFKYVLMSEGLMTVAMIVLLVTSMIFIPLAVKLSERIGKKQTYIAGMSLFALSVLIVFFLGHLLDIKFIFVMMFFSGMGFSTHYVLPWAIIPDTVEYDYSRTGIRREGVFYSLWTFSIKLGQALAGLLVGIILDAFGYLPDVPQTASAMLGIRLLIGPFTAVFFIVANTILWFYPIDRDAYEKIRDDIRKMEEGQ
ncbi:MAG: MFS transporter [Spirochaetae bacterium HGW-Spirochaetae-1]|jgi:GPH family glycoside/pentoside/hexuronide:cation symporter|nr:MAG: MFS transporter [Spirochaetae bacterium HGW-Spirochaetae-1]